MRRTWLLGALAVGMGVLWACSPIHDPFCPNGVWPFDGQTAVPLDAVIVVQTGASLPADAPPLDGTVTLTTANGRPVPFHTEVDARSGEIRILPDEPLEPHTRYELGAVDWYQLGEYPHWWGGQPTDRDYTITTFSTASRPALLEAHPTGDDRTFVLAFSEPVELDSLDGLLWSSAFTGSTVFATSAPEPTDATPIDTLDVAIEVLGTFEGDPHLVWVQPVDDLATFELDQVHLREGARSVSGEPVEPMSLDLDDLRTDNVAPLDRYSGAPYCLSML